MKKKIIIIISLISVFILAVMPSISAVESSVSNDLETAYRMEKIDKRFSDLSIVAKVILLWLLFAFLFCKSAQLYAWLMVKTGRPLPRN